MLVHDNVDVIAKLHRMVALYIDNSFLNFSKSVQKGTINLTKINYSTAVVLLLITSTIIGGENERA